MKSQFSGQAAQLDLLSISSQSLDLLFGTDTATARHSPPATTSNPTTLTLQPYISDCRC